MKANVRSVLVFLFLGGCGSDTSFDLTLAEKYIMRIDSPDFFM